MADRFTKPPEEKFDVEFTFEREEGLTAYVVSAVEGRAEDEDGEDVTADVLDNTLKTYSGNKAYLWVKDGLDGQEYEIYCLATMSGGQKLQKKVTMEVSSNA